MTQSGLPQDRIELGLKLVNDSAQVYVSLEHLEEIPEEIDLEQIRISDSLRKEFEVFQEKWTEEDMTWVITELNISREEEEEDSFDIQTEIARRVDKKHSWITRPLFSEDRTLMIVEYGNVCGMLCGHGITILYEFVDGKWVKKEVLQDWVS